MSEYIFEIVSFSFSSYLRGAAECYLVGTKEMSYARLAVYRFVDEGHATNIVKRSVILEKVFLRPMMCLRILMAHNPSLWVAHP